MRDLKLIILTATFLNILSSCLNEDNNVSLNTEESATRGNSTYAEQINTFNQNTENIKEFAFDGFSLKTNETWDRISTEKLVTYNKQRKEDGQTVPEQYYGEYTNARPVMLERLRSHMEEEED